jgi:hypothetical protein
LQGLVVFLFISGSLLVIFAPTVLMAAFSGASAPITVQKKNAMIFAAAWPHCEIILGISQCFSLVLFWHDTNTIFKKTKIYSDETKRLA